MNYLYPYIISRANSTKKWLGTDCLENYKEVTDFGPNIYKPGDIEYKFNNNGFRCDEFTLKSEIPIVFLGCSISEGMGLRQEDVWAYKLLEKIRNKTGKNIPYWNLGLGASSIDTQSSNLYLFSKIQPYIQYVFSYFPPFHRREYCFGNNVTTAWGPGDQGRHKTLGNIFIDTYFKNHQTNQSLMLIDSILDKNNTRMYCSRWGVEDNDFDLFDTFLNMNYFAWPEERLDAARDGMHHGPAYHAQLADKFWSIIEHHF